MRDGRTDFRTSALSRFFAESAAASMCPLYKFSCEDGGVKGAGAWGMRGRGICERGRQTRKQRT